MSSLYQKAEMLLMVTKDGSLQKNVWTDEFTISQLSADVFSVLTVFTAYYRP